MTTLLKTKLTIPPLRPDLVPRPHLVDRLNKGLRPGCCLILVSAPAGFGKTTLVTAWLRQVACPATWLSLDEGDNDPIRFLRYLIAALRKVAPSIAPGLGGALQSPQPPSPEELIASLINQIVGAPAAGVDTPIVLVLDDAHALTAPPVHRALNFLLDHLPANLRIVITTRADPPLPLARLRGRGQIVEVRQTDLRFEPGEAADFLAKILDDTLPDADIETLTSRTEGWPAGLRMAAAALRARAVATGERSPSQFIADFSGSQAYIVDYLGAEVLDRQPAHVRDFLLKTSVLDRFTASLCDAVMASPTATDPPQVRGRQMLPALADANLFLVPLDQKRRWYRYHHLFRDLLRQRLTIASPELPQALHRRASAWYEAAASAPDGSIRDTALMGEAVKHARAAEDPEFLAELLDRHAETLLTAGEIGIVLEGTVGLPVDAIQGRPLLLVFQALGHLVTSRLDAASRSIAAAETATQNAGADATAETTALVGMIAAMQAAIAFMRGEQTEVVERSGYALDHLPKRNHAWRGSAAMTLGDAHTLRGDLRDAAGAYQSAMLESDAADNRFLGLITRIKLADTYRGLGQLHRTGESCREHSAMAERLGLAGSARAGSILALRGEVLREWNRLDEAVDHLERGIAPAAGEHHIPILVWALPFLIHTHLSRGDLDAMVETVDDLDRIVRTAEVPVWGPNRLAAWRVRMWIAQGNPGYLQAAAELLASRGLDVTGAPPDAAPNYLREDEYLALIRLAIAQGSHERALAWLAWLLPAAQAGGRLGRVIEMRSLKARALAAADQESAAVATLTDALRMAAPEEYARLFLDEGEPMTPLLTRVAERQRDRGLGDGEIAAYVGRLLARFPVPAPAHERARDRGAEANAELVEPLSERELEVLRLVAGGATNREIAQELTIAYTTAKKHVSNIIGKLAVENRREAARRARAMGLVE